MGTFGQRLDSKRRGTQRDFAKFLGVPLTSYTNWVTGISLPKAEHLVLICSKLGVSADWLLGLSDQPCKTAGHIVHANGSAVAINGNNTVNGNIHAGASRCCDDCPLMQAAVKAVKQKDRKSQHS